MPITFQQVLEHHELRLRALEEKKDETKEETKPASEEQSTVPTLSKDDFDAYVDKTDATIDELNKRVLQLYELLTLQQTEYIRLKQRVEDDEQTPDVITESEFVQDASDEVIEEVPSQVEETSDEKEE